MTSIRRRLRLVPTASAIVSRVMSLRPLRIQSRRPGPAILVAMTSPSRPRFASQPPRMLSVRPCVVGLGGTGYISAVSMKLTPRSTARSSCACASASLFCSPQVIVPRHASETSRDVPGSVLRFMRFSSRGNPAFYGEGPLRLIEGLRERRVELDVDLRAARARLVERELAGDAPRVAGARGERFRLERPRMLDALPVERDPVVDARAVVEVDGHALVDAPVGARHLRAGLELRAD